jgi:hypothetical protein
MAAAVTMLIRGSMFSRPHLPHSPFKSTIIFCAICNLDIIAKEDELLKKRQRVKTACLLLKSLHSPRSDSVSKRCNRRRLLTPKEPFSVLGQTMSQSVTMGRYRPLVDP